MSNGYTPLRQSPLVNKYLKLIDEYIDKAPHVDNVYLKDEMFKALYDSIPLYLQNEYTRAIPYRGKLLKKVEK